MRSTGRRWPEGTTTVWRHEDRGEGSVGVGIPPNPLQQCCLMHCVVDWVEQAVASGIRSMGFAEAEVGKGGQCDT